MRNPQDPVVCAITSLSGLSSTFHLEKSHQKRTKPWKACVPLSQEPLQETTEESSPPSLWKSNYITIATRMLLVGLRHSPWEHLFLINWRNCMWNQTPVLFVSLPAYDNQHHLFAFSFGRLRTYLLLISHYPLKSVQSPPRILTTDWLSDGPTVVNFVSLAVLSLVPMLHLLFGGPHQTVDTNWAQNKLKLLICFPQVTLSHIISSYTSAVLEPGTQPPNINCAQVAVKLPDKIRKQNLQD